MRQPAGPREPSDPHVADVGGLLAQVDGRTVAEADPAVDARGTADLLLGQIADRWEEWGLAHARTLPGREGRFYRPRGTPGTPRL